MLALLLLPTLFQEAAFSQTAFSCISSPVCLLRLGNSLLFLFARCLSPCHCFISSFFEERNRLSHPTPIQSQLFDLFIFSHFYLYLPTTPILTIINSHSHLDIKKGIPLSIFFPKHFFSPVCLLTYLLDRFSHIGAFSDCRLDLTQCGAKARQHLRH